MIRTTRTTRSPDEFYDQRIAALTNFRCDRCHGRYPNTPEFLVIQDGARLCRPNCAFDHSKSEWDAIYANARRDAAEMNSNYVKSSTAKLAQAPDWSLMDGVSALTDITFNSTSYPHPIPLSPGSSGVAAVFDGVGFTSTDTLTFSSPHITVTTPSISTDRTTFTSTVSAASICPLGDYDLLFNSNIFRGAVRVRST